MKMAINAQNSWVGRALNRQPIVGQVRRVDPQRPFGEFT
jgi:hypothetical protein